MISAGIPSALLYLRGMRIMLLQLSGGHCRDLRTISSFRALARLRILAQGALSHRRR